jgi:uncharacterized BrkB/YihY/UPF0761 family membrane protein
MLLGNHKVTAVYIMLTVILIIIIFKIPLPVFLDFIGSTAVQAFDTEKNDPELSAFIAGRIVFSLIGAVLIFYSLYPSKKRHSE